MRTLDNNWHIAIDARNVTKILDGLGRYVLEIINHVEKKENEKITIFHTKDFPFEYIRNKSFLNFVLINIKGSHPLQQIVLPLKIKKLKIDCYYYPFIDPPILSPAKINIFAVHDLNHFFLSKYAATERKLAILVAKFFIFTASLFYNKIIVFSNFVKNELEKNVNFSKNKITVIYHGLSEISFKAEKSPPPNIGPYLLYVGNNRPHKNLDRLLSSFQILLRKNPTLKLIIAGNLISRFLNVEEYCKTLGIQDNTILLGKVSDAELIQLYKDCEMIVYPSLSEGFGLPILEAWYFHVPMIVSNTSCLPEIGGEAVAYFDPTDVNDMAQKIHDYLSHKEKRDMLTTLGHKRLGFFTWRKSIASHFSLFRVKN